MAHGKTLIRERNLEDVDSAEFKEFVADALLRSIFTIIHSVHGDIVIGPEWILGFAENEGMLGMPERVL